MINFPKLITPIQQEVPLAPFTTWKIGGPAQYLAEPTEEEAPRLLKWATENEIPIFFLGRGSNVLIADSGLRGLVILTRNSMRYLDRKGDHIVAGAGVSLPRLSKFAAKQGFSGFEFLVGIPGTVGGGLVINAGLTVFRPREMRSIVEYFEAVSLDGVVTRLTMDDIHAGYRHTDLLNDSRLVLTATFKLENEGDPVEIHRNTIEHLRERKSKQPLSQPTAGSTFKSPPGSNGAGWYIEQSGLKGYQIGGARISMKHANWIENAGNATAEDVRRLIDHVRLLVAETHKIELEPEIQLLGDHT